jgi:hypothetical protein
MKDLVEKEKEKKKVVHHGFICDGCDGPIKGIRYRCSKRDDYDLCEECEAKHSKTLPHPMLKIRHPRHAPKNLIC